MKNIIFIAPPVAGKGTFSDYLEKKYHYIHISMGDLIREKIKEKTLESQRLNDIIKSGQLLDDNIIFDLLRNKLKTLKKTDNFIMEGIPRNLHQAEILDIILHDFSFDNYLVVEITNDLEILKKRMIGRRICTNCGKIYNLYFDKYKPKNGDSCDVCSKKLIARNDDNEKSFKVRYDIFKKNFEPIKEYYHKDQRFKTIDNSSEDHTESLKELDRIVGAKFD